MKLVGKPIVDRLFEQTDRYLASIGKEGKYVSIFLLSDDYASEVYVRMKSKYAKKLGIFANIIFAKDWDLNDLLSNINQCNQDNQCLGILVQLPVGEKFKDHQLEILDAIDPSKDIDGLSSITYGKNSFGKQGFLGATPKAVREILDGYSIDYGVGRIITLVGQSNLIGKPLASFFMNQRATVCTINSKTPLDIRRELLIRSDIIISATGVGHLINETVLSSHLESKVLIDIGYSKKDAKAVGDFDQDYYIGKVAGITPVPGGIGPVTVASIFHNILELSRE